MPGNRLISSERGQHNENTNYNEPTYNMKTKTAYIPLGNKMDRFLTRYTRMYPNRVKGAKEAANMNENNKTEIDK